MSLEPKESGPVPRRHRTAIAWPKAINAAYALTAAACAAGWLQARRANAELRLERAQLAAQLKPAAPRPADDIAAERLERIEAGAILGSWEFTLADRKVAVSKSFRVLAGVPAAPSAVALADLEALVAPADRANVRAAAADALATRTFEADFRVVFRDGTSGWRRACGQVASAAGAVNGAAGTLLDISAEKLLSAQLAQANLAAETAERTAQLAERRYLDRDNVLELVALDRPLSEIAQSIAEAVAHHPGWPSCSIQIQLPAGERISASAQLDEAIGRALAEIPITQLSQALTAAPIEGLFCGVDGETPGSIQTTGSQTAYLAAPIYQNTFIAGAIVVVVPARQQLTAADQALLASWARFAALAIERRGLYEKLSFQAQYDELTTLLNRASLYESVSAQLAAAVRDGSALSVLCLDVDRFKEINDHHGHGAGDEVLRTLAKRMLENIRRTDVAARVGGDRFAVVLPGVSARSDAERIAEIIVAAMTEPIDYDGKQLQIGASLGIAVFPADGRDADPLLNAAEQDMLRHKETHQPRHAEPAASHPGFAVEAPLADRGPRIKDRWR